MREMTPPRTRGANHTLSLVRTLPADAEAVFHALTDPVELHHWFGPEDRDCVAEARIDLRVGGSYAIVMHAPGGAGLVTVAGVYREIDRPRRLVYTWSWDTPGWKGRESLVEIDLTPAAGGATELRLKQTALLDDDAVRSHTLGWEGSLARLARRMGGG